MEGGKRQEVRNQLGVEPPCPEGFESEPQPSREEGGWGGPRGLGWGDTHQDLAITPGKVLPSHQEQPGMLGWDAGCKNPWPQLGWDPKMGPPAWLAGMGFLAQTGDPGTGPPSLAARNGVPRPDCLPAIKCPLMGL